MLKYLLIVLGLAYFFWPYDLAPDVFVGVGWIDDLVLLGFLWWYLYGARWANFRKLFAGRYRPDADGGSGRFGQGRAGNGGRHHVDGSAEKDPYTVLGLPPNASQEQVRKAYRELANRYHPDKVSHLGEEFKILAEKRFKEIQKAYQELNLRK